MLILSRTGPFCIESVPLLCTCFTIKGHVRGASIFGMIPGLMYKTLSPERYWCCTHFLFSRMTPLSISSCFRCRIATQSALNGKSRSISRPNTSWAGVACNVVWKVLCEGCGSHKCIEGFVFWQLLISELKCCETIKYSLFLLWAMLGVPCACKPLFNNAGFAMVVMWSMIPFAMVVRWTWVVDSCWYM